MTAFRQAPDTGVGLLSAFCQNGPVFTRIRLHDTPMGYIVRL